ncbi:MAG: CocE/NonD family hydrolase [bacterium]|nr:CocE/NonD family hydrolase [bacterium]
MAVLSVVFAVIAILVPGPGFGTPPATKTIMIPMRDEVELSTDLYFPDDTATDPWPVVLVRTPYNKEKLRKYGRYFSGHGYAVAIQDVRGQYDSEGEFELWINEKDDGYDTIEWLAKQKWCDGKIGMAGGSYNGWVQFIAAIAKPPHLVTIIPVVPMTEPFFYHVYPGGMFHMTQHARALPLFGGKHSGNAPAGRLVRDWRNQLDHLPVIDLDKKIFGGEREDWRQHLRHNTNDSYWDRSNYLERLEQVNLPVFLVGGWIDFAGIATKASYQHLKNSKNEHIKLMIGPWAHQTIGSARMADIYFGEAAAVDVFALYREWFDFWLKGIDNGIVEEPLVQVFGIGLGRWLKADTYPLPKTSYRRFFLTSEEGANTLNGDGKLRLQEPPSGDHFDGYTYDPGDPTPSLFFDAASSYGGRVSRRQDILVYQTEPLQESLMVVGPVSAELYASSSAKDTDWVVYWRMIDEGSGEQRLIGRGTLRARFRNSSRNPEPLESGKIYKYTLDLWHVGVLIPKGWRIRMEVASACFPEFSRNLNTGGNNETETEYIAARQRIHHSREYPSCLVLPVVDPEKHQ